MAFQVPLPSAFPVTSVITFASTAHPVKPALLTFNKDVNPSATTNMAGWSAEDYKLTPAETAELFGSAAELLQKLRIGSITCGQTGTRTEIVRALQFAD